MRNRAYFPEMLKALRQSLKHLEEVKSIDAEDPTLAKAKGDIREKLTEYERSEHSEHPEHTGT